LRTRGSWREVEVQRPSTQRPPSRLRIDTRGDPPRRSAREFIGFNRASNAVIEAGGSMPRGLHLPAAVRVIEAEFCAACRSSSIRPRALRSSKRWPLLTDFVAIGAPDGRQDRDTQWASGRGPSSSKRQGTSFHFGPSLDLRGSFGRRFWRHRPQAAPGPTLAPVSPAWRPALEVVGEDADRAGAICPDAALDAHRVSAGAPHRRPSRAFPSARPELGSGTQIALAVGRALAELHGFDASASNTSHARARPRRDDHRSVTMDLSREGGPRRRRRDAAAMNAVRTPARADFPSRPSWRCVPRDSSNQPGNERQTRRKKLLAALAAFQPGARDRASSPTSF